MHAAKITLLDQQIGRLIDKLKKIGDWKGVRYGTTAPIELYNLKEDPSELTNIADNHLDIVNEMRSLFKTMFGAC